MVISQNMVNVAFLSILVTFQPIDPCEQNKERTYGQLYPPYIARADLTLS